MLYIYIANDAVLMAGESSMIITWGIKSGKWLQQGQKLSYVAHQLANKTVVEGGLNKDKTCQFTLTTQS